MRAGLALYLLAEEQTIACNAGDEADVLCQRGLAHHEFFIFEDELHHILVFGNGIERAVQITHRGHVGAIGQIFNSAFQFEGFDAHILIF